MIPGLAPVTVDSLAFLALAAMVVLAAWSGRPARFRAALAAASLVMAASWLKPLDALALALFLAPPYLVARRLWGRGDAAGPWLPALILWQVGLFIALRRYEPLDRVLVHPIAIIGLSYMLFRVLHLVIEAPLLGRLPLSPLRYLSYVGAFWTLLAGPIQRYDEFCAGTETAGRPSPEMQLAAGHRAVNGLIKAFLIAPVLLNASKLDFLTAPGAGWSDALLVFYGYPAYLYLNFSGYTDVVVALAALCGTRLPENFDRPFLSRNIQEFWGRWHISFGIWIRSYVFTPLCKRLLNGSRGRHADALTAVALLATFVVVGLWHGTTPGFVVFGLAHGAAIVLSAVWGGLLKARLGKAGRKAFLAHPATAAVATLLTFHFVCLSMQAFANPLAATWAAWAVFLAG
ncbi:MAG: MBOAT family protein [Magnetospirillum sp.]|nr:MBOAT family protein [Magnetospirillum sp.]